MSSIHRSKHGDVLGLDHKDFLLAKGYKSGFDFDQFELPSPSRQVQFLNPVGAGVALGTTPAAVGAGWRSRVGSDGQCVNWTVTPAVGGGIVGTIGDTTASMAVSGVQLDSGLSWKANQGDLIIQAKIKLSQITLISAFF